MTNINNDLDFIIAKTQRLQDVVDNKDYHLLESKELIRQHLITQFFANYSPEEIVTVTEKLEHLVKLSESISEQCETIFEDTKQDILKLKRSSNVKNAYK